MNDRIRINHKQSSTPISHPLLATSAQSTSIDSSFTHPIASSHDLSRISPRCQAKLSISQPGDAYEQEADKVAQQVMAMGDSSLQQETTSSAAQNLQRKPIAASITPLVQRAEIPEEEEEETLQMKPVGNFAIQREEIPEEEDELLQAKYSIQRIDNGLTASNDISNQLHSRRGGGSPLADNVRSFMEPRFGVDFSHVKIHTDSQAIQMARDVGAQAFAYGSDVYFGAGKSPGNNELTAHELTHVVQQTGNMGRKVHQYHQSPFGKIQRYDSYEHAQSGDRAPGGGSLNIQGVNVTAGEINALADFYHSPEDLSKADPTELKQLVELIRKQKADPKSVSEADWDKATNGRYNELNLKNSQHFSPHNAALIAPQTAGGDNRSTWEGYHKQALAKSRQAAALLDWHPPMQPASGNERAELLEQAKLINFFGEHYLTDAFSAGHLFNKDDTVAPIKKNLDGLKPEQLSTIFNTVAVNVWAKKSSLISQYEGKKVVLGFDTWWVLDSAKLFKAVLEGIYEDPEGEGKQALYGAIVKAAHDRLNTQKNDDGTIGVPVMNDFEEWTLSGDRTLDTSPITQKWLTKALEQSRANIQETAQLTSTAPDEEKIKRVIACLPRPTANSTTAIHDLLEKIVNPTGGMVEAISEVLAVEVGSILEVLVTKCKVRKKE